MPKYKKYLIFELPPISEETKNLHFTEFRYYGVPKIYQADTGVEGGTIIGYSIPSIGSRTMLCNIFWLFEQLLTVDPEAFERRNNV